MVFLNLIRWKNLLLIALMQLVFRYGFLKQQGNVLALNHFQYFLLILTTLLIAGAGYIINDIYDQDTDAINRPESNIVGKKIKETTAYNYYFMLNIVGVCIGFYLANVIMRPNFSILFIIISFLLYLYASSLKQTILVGNILIALLTSLSIIIIGIFDLYPSMYAENEKIIKMEFGILIDYACFNFLIHFIREIIKDLEDIEGDKKMGMSTLAVSLGIDKTTKIVAILSCIPIVILFIYVNNHYFQPGLYFMTLYSIIFLLTPLAFFSIRCWFSETKSDFKKLSLVLKLILLFGILSILVQTANKIYNA
jgi:4-hydroxybenzoate polyprenyltransferase